LIPFFLYFTSYIYRKNHSLEQFGNFFVYCLGSTKNQQKLQFPIIKKINEKQMKSAKIPPILLPISAVIIPIIGIITKYLVAANSYIPLEELIIISILLLIGYVGSFRFEMIKKHTDDIFHGSLFLLMLLLTWTTCKNNFGYMFVTNFQVSYILIGLTQRKTTSLIFFILSILFFYTYLHFNVENPIVPFSAMFPSMILLSSIMGFVTVILMKKDEELTNVYSEKDKLLASLQVSDKHLRAIFESSHQAFLLLDMDLKILLFNNATKRFAKMISNQDVKIGDSIFPFVIEKYLKKTKEMLFDARNKGVASTAIGKYKIVTDEYAWTEFYINPLYSDSEIVGIFINIQDITEVKTAELELRTSNDELKQFAYIVSHDLKEPLRTINSFSQLLSRKLSNTKDENISSYLGFITAGAKRMHLLLNDLMSYSTIGGKADKNAEIVNLNDVIQAANQNLKIKLEESNAEIYVDNLPQIKANTSQMIHLFQNLISNAIKFREKDKNPVINISYKKLKTSYEITVQDNGIGIDKAYQSKIFDIFKRLHNDDEYEGTGIGLSLCQKIVTNLGGVIQVDSTVGIGSTFTVSLPIKSKEIS
jgi:PAS domain S-box-containing protein